MKVKGLALAFAIQQSIKGDKRSYGKKHERKYVGRIARKSIRSRLRGIDPGAE